MSGNNYHIRYMIEEWDKPAENKGIKKMPGVKMSTTDYGYADDIFLASIMRNEDGSIESIFISDTVGRPGPSLKLLEAVRDAINHHLEKHV